MNQAISPRRIALIDVLRGVALVAMFVFHGAWDVSFFRIVRFDPGQSIGWIIYARLIAGSFLLLSGVNLVLATRDGIRWAAYFRRFIMVVLAALLVSAATYFALPQGWVFFGILHQIALASVLALPFLRLPAAAALIAAAIFFIVPHFLRSEIFATPWLWWVGLAPVPPASFDYVPLFPWFGNVLVGIAIGKLGIARGLDRRLATWRPVLWPGRLLAFGGRHSLAVYLLHQPILYGFFFLVAHVLLPNTAADAARADCRDRCVSLGNNEAGCENYCGCVFGELGTAGLMQPMLDNALNAEQMDRLRGFARTCTAKALPQEPVSNGEPAPN